MNEVLIITGLTAWLSISLMYPYLHAGKGKKSYAWYVGTMFLLSPIIGYAVIKLFLEKRQQKV